MVTGPGARVAVCMASWLVACEAAPVATLAPVPQSTPDARASPTRVDAGTDADADADAPDVVGPDVVGPDAGLGQFPPTFPDDAADPVAEIALDAREVCARRESGAVFCWGQLPTPPPWYPSDALHARLARSGPGPWPVALPAPAERLFGGPAGLCARLRGGRVHCWGPEPPEAAVEWPGAFTVTPQDRPELAGSDEIAVAYRPCWRREGRIQCVGTPISGFRAVPGLEVSSIVEIEGPPDFEALWPLEGLELFCARRTDGSVWCWDFFGFQGPDGPHPGSLDAVEVFSGGTDLADGNSETCALVQGQPVCASKYGEWRPQDAPVTPDLVELSGARSMCGRTAAGGVVCWGSDAYGQLGRGRAHLGGFAPGPIALTEPVTSLQGFDSTFCALTERNAVVCWGGNEAGQLGTGVGISATPHRVASPTPLSNLVVGRWMACATDAVGQVHCWGQLRASSGPCRAEATAYFDVPGFDLGAEDPLALGWGSGCAIQGHRLRCFAEAHPGVTVSETVWPCGTS